MLSSTVQNRTPISASKEPKISNAWACGMQNVQRAPAQGLEMLELDLFWVLFWCHSATTTSPNAYLPAEPRNKETLYKLVCVVVRRCSLRHRGPNPPVSVRKGIDRKALTSQSLSLPGGAYRFREPLKQKKWQRPPQIRPSEICELLLGLPCQKGLNIIDIISKAHLLGVDAVAAEEVGL